MAIQPNPERQNITTSLDAKLHQGYDPNTEFKEQGQLLGSVPFQGETENRSVWAELVSDISNAVKNMFSNNANYNSDSGIVINEGDNDLSDPAGRTGMPSPNLGGAGNAAEQGATFGIAGGVEGSGLANNLPGGSLMAANAFNSSAGISGPAPSSSSNSPPRDDTPDDTPDDPPSPPEEPENPVIPTPPSSPVLAAPPASGNEDQPVPLVVTVTSDPDSVTTIIISNIPPGVTLSAGINNGDGTWTLTPAQLSGLAMIPPENSSGTYVLGVTVISTENGFTATTSGNLVITVIGVADMPVVSADPASGNENTVIALTIDAALTDVDGSEMLTIIISNVPNGAVLSSGIDNGDGTWTLNAGQLVGLTFTPPMNVSGSFNLVVTAIASEGNSSASNNTTLPITVTGIASTPVLAVTAAAGSEDTAIALNISAMLTDNTETLSIIISGVPSGAILSAGIDNGDGTWSLIPSQLTGLTITPPQNSDIDFVLSITAISADSGHFAMISGDLPVTVNGVANVPALSVSPATGNEDTSIALDINAALSDMDGSEILSIVISNIPDGAVLSAGLYAGNNSWILNPAQLAGLTITPPENYNGTLNLQVTAVATEGEGDSVSVTVPLVVTVSPVSDPPVLNVNAALGNEDTAIALDIQIDANPGDVLTILIANVPVGAALSAGINNGDGTWSLNVAQLAGLTVTPPLHSDADFNLTVTVTATESDGSISSDSSVLNVSVTAVADAPNVLAANVSGAIDTQINLDISGSLVDTDGSESITYVIEGIPDGFTLNQGANNGDNSWTLTPAQLAGLKLISPYHFQGTLNLVAYAVSHESANGDVERSLPDSFTVTIGDPLLGINIDLGLGIGTGGGLGLGVGIEIGNILNPGGIVIMEDSPLLLNGITGLLGSILSPLQLSLLADVQIAGIPAGVSLSSGTDLGNGVYSLAGVDLDNLYLIAAPNSDQDFTLTLTAQLLSLVTISLGITAVHVVGVADAPTLNVSFDQPQTGDLSVPITIISALTDTDGSETLSITLSNLPAGVAPNIGINNADGSWTIPVAQLSSLALLLPEYFSGDLNFTVTATSTEREGDFTNTVYNGLVHVDPVNNAPLISILPIFGSENNDIFLNLGITLQDNDGSESLASVLIGGLPVGGILSHGTDNGDGTWTVNPADIANLHLMVPEHYSGDNLLSVTVFTADQGSNNLLGTTANIPLHIDAQADIPLLSVSDSSGDSGSLIDLDISSSLIDTDGSETLSIVIDGIPQGVILSAGLNNGNGSWILSEDQLDHLTLKAPDHFIGDIQLSATAYSQETANGDIASIVAQFTVHIDEPAISLMVNNDADAIQSGWMDNSDPASVPGGNDYSALDTQPSQMG